VPVIGLAGTDLLKRRDDMVVAPDPFGEGKRSVVAKAMRPDVAVFHADKADRHGNVSCGYQAETVILAEASGHVVVTAEDIVERITERDAVGAFIPSILVDAVVHAPFGAHPGGMSGRYDPDKAAMQEYVAASRDDASFAAYLERYVFEASFDEYLERYVPHAARTIEPVA
jgi:glutaconate CoA-transferase subunit A